MFLHDHDEDNEGGFFIEDADQQESNDINGAQGGPNMYLPLPSHIQAPIVVPLAVAMQAPVGIIPPTAVCPLAVRPMALRPSTSQAMLQKIQQDFQENSPPPVESNEIVTLPISSETNNLLDDVTAASSRVTIGDTGNICTSAATPNGLEPMHAVVPPAPIAANPKMLGLRRTVSESSDLMSTTHHHLIDPATAAQVMATQNQIKDLEKQIQELQKQMAAAAHSQLIFPPYNGVALQLPKPVPIRPMALRTSQSHPALTNLVNNNAPQHAVQMPRPDTALANPVPQRPKPKRQSSSRTMRRPSWYHRVAAQNRLGCIQEDPLLNVSEDVEENGRLSPLTAPVGIRSCHEAPSDRIQAAKRTILQELNRTAMMGEDAQDNTPVFQAALQTLIREYDSSHFDPRAPVLSYHPYQLQLEGIGIAVGKPSFPGCIGRNKRGDPMFKLGTMSFDMFRPTELIVSVQGTFCLIDIVDRNNLQDLKNVPKNLVADVRDGTNPVRTYNIVTPFTIEVWRSEFGEKSPNKGVEQPIHGVMTTYGFILPFPTQNRFSVWFTGGSLEVDGNKNEKWFQIFDKDAAPQRTAFESSKLFAAKLLMGACVNDEMDKDGKLSYTLSRPVASYIDLVYLDNSLQVLRSSSGMVYVHKRLPGGSEAFHQFAYSDEMLPSSVDSAEDSSNGYPNASHHGSVEETAMADPRIIYGAQLDPGIMHGGHLDLGTNCEARSQIGSGIEGGDQLVPGVIRADHVGSEQQCSSVASNHELVPCSVVETTGMQQAASEADVLNCQVDASPTCRLEQNDAVINRSSLKKISSYPTMEEPGTNIPINHDSTAWNALPRPNPTQQTTEAHSDPRTNIHKRGTSDPSELWSCAFWEDPPPDRTDTESLSTSENDEEVKQ